MRHTRPVAVRTVTEYRVQFIVSEVTASMFGTDVVTGVPGVMRQLPMAKKFLQSHQKGREAWLEKRTLRVQGNQTLEETEWERVNA
jgi:hypothetical protein